MKKTVCTILAILLVFMLAACGGGTGSSAPAAQPVKDSSAAAPAPAGQEPELNITQIYGSGPNGETAASSADLELTDEEIQQLADGGFKVAICMHQTDNAVNYTKMEVMRQAFEDYGIEVVAVTDAQQDPAKMQSDVESAIAHSPDLIVSCCADQDSNVATFEMVKEQGIQMVFYEVPPAGWKAGEDYAALISSDYEGNGRFAGEYMAWLLNYTGTVGVVYLDANVWTCNVRDQAFRDVIAQYPDMEIVAESGFAEVSLAGAAADGILANHPDIDGIYATWDDPAEQVMASAVSAGRDDIIITTTDLGDNTARVIAENGPIKAVGAPSSYTDGMAITHAACYALLGKELPSTFIVTPTTGVARSNVLEAYELIYNKPASSELTAAWEAAQ